MFSASSRIQYVYLLSAPHSGSTLIAALLGCHDQIATVGEFATDFPPDLQCSCGVPYNICPFWTKILSIYNEQYHENLMPGNLNINLGLKENPSFFYELFYHFFPFYFLDKLRDTFFKRFSKLYDQSMLAIERSLRLASIIMNEEKASIFLDTTKNPFQVKFLSQHSNVDLKVIVLVRDGRAVTWSLLNKEKWSLKRSVETWLWANRNIERVCKHYLIRENIFFLKLEDLCSNPEFFLKKILDFLKVKPKIKIRSIHDSHLHIIGNKMRLNFNGVIRKPDESWRQHLTPEQLAYFEKKAGWLNKKLGYS